MSWDDARFLLALARARNLSEAARALGVSHTTVARRVAALEKSVRSPLVERLPEGVRLTAVGRELASIAERIEAAADDFRRRAMAVDARLEGTVRVTSTESVGALLLGPTLAALAARHPGLTIELDSESRSLSLARREADVAVRLVRARERSTAGRRIAYMAYAVYAAARGAAPAVDGTVPLLAYESPVARAQADWLGRRFPRASVALRSGSTLTLAAAAASGAGLAVLPCFVGDTDQRLMRVAGGGDPPSSDIWLVVHRDLRRSAAIAAVTEAVVNAIRRQTAVTGVYIPPPGP